MHDKPGERLNVTAQKAMIMWPNSEQVKHLFKIINTVTSEPEININKDYVSLREMDNRRMCMLDVQLNASGAEIYDTTEMHADKLTFSLDAEQLLKRVFKNTYKNEHFKLAFTTEDKPETDTLTLTLIHDCERRFTVTVLNYDKEQLPTPKIAFTADTYLKIEPFIKLLNDINDEVTIQITDETVTLTEKDEYATINFETTLNKDNANVLSIHANEPTKSKFAITYLRDMLKAMQPLTNEIQLSLSNTSILKLTFNTKDDFATITCYLAPRDLNEDD
jgi:hypothetical protein